MTTSRNETSRQPVTVRAARWSATHPWRAIGLWVVFVAVALVAGGVAGTTTATERDMGLRDSGRAADLLHEGGLEKPAVENVLISSRGGGLDLPAAERAAADLAARMRALPAVAAVGSPATAPDGTALMVPVTMRGDPVTAPDRVRSLREQTAAVAGEHPGLRVEQTGPASIGSGVTEQVTKDLVKAETASLPVTLLIMLVAFGAIVAAGVPVLLAISAVAAATGLTALSSQLIPAVDTVNSMILLIGMAVGVDYSLFYLKREREERARGRGHVDAIEVAAATSGHSVVVSAFAVMVAMAGLYLSGSVIFSSLATGAILVVAVAMLGSLTVLPALLAKLGRAVDRPRVPVLWRLTNRPGEPRLWPALLRPALRHPVATLVLSVAALVALALPALGMNLKSTGTDELPRVTPAMQSYDRLTAAFPGEHTPHEVVVRAPAERADQVRAGLRRLGERVQGDRLFAADGAPQVRASADGRVHAITVASPYPSNSGEARQALHTLRGDLLPATVGAVPGAEYAIGGETAANRDFAGQIGDRLPWVIGSVLLLTFVMMALTFRSVVVALTAIAVNLLSAGASFGLLVLVFQHGWAEGLLGFESTGSVVAYMPLFIFAVLFGLSMDYHVFVVSRIREAARRGLPTREAVAQGITRSAGVVTSAAVVMVSVFAIFVSLSLMEMKQMGVGLSAAVLIDAVLVRIVILPSLMTLLGRANWWPGRLSRRPAHPGGRPVAAPPRGTPARV